MSAFLQMGRCNGLLKSSIWRAPRLPGTSVLCFLVLTLGVAHWGGCSGWLLDSGHPVSILSSLRVHPLGSCNVMAWWLQHPVFTDMTGGIFFSLTACGSFHGHAFIKFPWSFMKFISWSTFSHLLYIKSSLVIINRSEAKILELKNTVIEMKISLKRIQQQISASRKKNRELCPEAWI